VPNRSKPSSLVTWPSSRLGRFSRVVFQSNEIGNRMRLPSGMNLTGLSVHSLPFSLNSLRLL
jgi:hypothetical protein